MRSGYYYLKMKCQKRRLPTPDKTAGVNCCRSQERKKKHLSETFPYNDGNNMRLLRIDLNGRYASSRILYGYINIRLFWKMYV